MVSYLALSSGSVGVDLYLLLAMLDLVALLFCRDKRAIILALLVTSAAVPLLKDFFLEDRPCLGAINCPPDAGLPSGHTAMAFVFAAGSLGSPAFWFLFPSSLLVAYTRVRFGVHSIEQVAAGAGVGAAIFFLSKEFLASVGRFQGQRAPWRARRRFKRIVSWK